MGLPWIEVMGEEILPSGAPKWRGGLPVPVLREGPSMAWECDECARRAEEQRHRERNGVHVRSIRVVDYYWPNGSKFREIFSASEELRNGEVIGLELSANLGRDGGLRIVGPSTMENGRRIRAEVERVLKEKRSRGALVDSPMEWNKSNLCILEDPKDSYMYYPLRYRWSSKNSRWFLAREYLHRRWDDPVDREGPEGNARTRERSQTRRLPSI